jgi:hypothetical protein
VSSRNSGVPPRQTQAHGRALQRVVQDAQDLLVVRIAGLRVGQLVEIDEFVQADQQAAEAGQPHESRHQLELVIDRGVVDDGAHAERLPGIGLGG